MNCKVLIILSILVIVTKQAEPCDSTCGTGDTDGDNCKTTEKDGCLQCAASEFVYLLRATNIETMDQATTTGTCVSSCSTDLQFTVTKTADVTTASQTQPYICMYCQVGYKKCANVPPTSNVSKYIADDKSYCSPGYKFNDTNNTCLPCGNDCSSCTNLNHTQINVDSYTSSITDDTEGICFTLGCLNSNFAIKAVQNESPTNEKPQICLPCPKQYIKCESTKIKSNFSVNSVSSVKTQNDSPIDCKPNYAYNTTDKRCDIPDCTAQTDCGTTSCNTLGCYQCNTFKIIKIAKYQSMPLSKESAGECIADGPCLEGFFLVKSSINEFLNAASNPNYCLQCPPNYVKCKAKDPNNVFNTEAVAANDHTDDCSTDYTYANTLCTKTNPCHTSCGLEECNGTGAEKCKDCSQFSYITLAAHTAVDLVAANVVGTCSASCSDNQILVLRSTTVSPTQFKPYFCVPCPTGVSKCHADPANVELKVAFIATACSSGYSLESDKCVKNAAAAASTTSSTSDSTSSTASDSTSSIQILKALVLVVLTRLI